MPSNAKSPNARAEDELRRFNVTLEERVEGRAADLKEAVAELEACSYTASHDLRAPLRAMNAFSEMLLAEYAGRPLDDDGQDYARMISSAASRMDRLVQDLIEFARLSRAHIRLERINTRDLLQEILRQLEPDFRNRGVELNVAEGLDDVLGHRSTLAMAIGNLLSPQSSSPQARFLALPCAPSGGAVEPGSGWKTTESGLIRNTTIGFSASSSA